MTEANTDGLLERLDKGSADYRYEYYRVLFADAAAEIRRLQAVVEQLAARKTKTYAEMKAFYTARGLKFLPSETLNAAREWRACRITDDQFAAALAATGEVMTVVETISTAAKPGVYYGMNFPAYADIQAVNWHTLEPYRRSAKHGRFKNLHPDFATDSQVAGEAFHCAILEPGRFAEQYITRPKFEGHPNSKAYKDLRSEWEFNNADKVHLSLDEMANLRAMQESARAHPIASAIIDGKGKNELSIVWRDEQTGALLKGRVDRLCRVKIGILDPTSQTPEADAIVMADFKTTRSIEPVWFNKDRARFAYHAQLAMYLDGVTSAQPGASILPLIVAVENEAPFDVVVYQPDDDAIENGRRLYRRLLKTHLACARKKDWPGISNALIPLSIDPWERENKLED